MLTLDKKHSLSSSLKANHYCINCFKYNSHNFVDCNLEKTCSFNHLKFLYSFNNNDTQFKVLRLIKELSLACVLSTDSLNMTDVKCLSLKSCAAMVFVGNKHSFIYASEAFDHTESLAFRMDPALSCRILAGKKQFCRVCFYYSFS